jgi:putative heme-binding domain-containing protein
VKIGPELDGIGNRGLERLLEDVVDPNRNVDQAFRSTLLTTIDGRALAGLALREEGQVLVLADAQGKEQRVPLAEISERGVSPLSPMPANAIELVKEAEFYHLLGYLLSQRQAAEK